MGGRRRICIKEERAARRSNEKSVLHCCISLLVVIFFLLLFVFFPSPGHVQGMVRHVFTFSFVVSNIIRSLAHCQKENSREERKCDLTKKVYTCLSLPQTLSVFLFFFFSRSSAASTADQLSTYLLPSLAIIFSIRPLSVLSSLSIA